MKKLRTENLLIEIENKIGHLTTPALRADSALRLLRMEQANMRDIDLLKGAQSGLKEMLVEMDKVEQFSEINLAIKILAHYLESNSFSLIAIPRSNIDKITVDLFEELNRRLEEIVIKFDNEKSRFQ